VEIGLIIKYKKYTTVRICPVKIYGLSTGRAPIQVNRITVETSIQKLILDRG